jgi:hypothetical protein
MCAPIAIYAAAAALSAYSAYQTAQTNKDIAKHNAEVSEVQAQDALKRGEQEAMDVRRRGAELKSSQRATMAAKGLDLTFGTAGQIQDETDFFTETDAATVRTNARKEAWNLRAQRRGYEMEAAGQRPGLAAGSSLLSSASQVSGRWQQYRQAS